MKESLRFQVGKCYIVPGFSWMLLVEDVAPPKKKTLTFRSTAASNHWVKPELVECNPATQEDLLKYADALRSHSHNFEQDAQVVEMWASNNFAQKEGNDH